MPNCCDEFNRYAIIKWVTQSGADLTALIRKSINYISKTIEPAREGRFAFRRMKNIKNNIHYPAYKYAL